MMGATAEASFADTFKTSAVGCHLVCRHQCELTKASSVTRSDWGADRCCFCDALARRTGYALPPFAGSLRIAPAACPLCAPQRRGVGNGQMCHSPRTAVHLADSPLLLHRCLTEVTAKRTRSLASFQGGSLNSTPTSDRSDRLDGDMMMRTESGRLGWR